LIWWILTVVVVVTFVGGFVFLLGAGLNSSNNARTRGDIGTVDGAGISRVDFQNALGEQRAAFQQRTGADASPEEERNLASFAWRGLVTQKLLGARARQLGLKAYDRDVVLALQS